MNQVMSSPKVPQTLRSYQVEAITAIRDAWKTGDTKPLAALATGAGKTTILAQLLVETVEPETQRALVIGHTQEIIYQLRDRIVNQFAGRLNRLFGIHLRNGIGLVMGAQDDPDARIVVATRQSLHPQRLKRLLQSGIFDVLAIDEAHHALGDNSYGGIIDTLKQANPNLQIVGLTATPKRTDRKALGTVFNSICYSWLIPDGIQQGYLTPVTRVKVTTRVDLSHVKSSHGDYSPSKLMSALQMANWLDLCQAAFQEHILSTGRQCLAFLPSVAMSEHFAQFLQAKGVSAAHIDGNTPKLERQALLRDYATGKLQVISNMAVLTEGFDAPATSAIFLARPTRSQTLFTQIVGRGLRPFPNKHDCLLIDMTVLDTKALEVGTLLGKSITCPDCQADYYDGLKNCPKCGAAKPDPKTTPKEITCYLCKKTYSPKKDFCPHCGASKPRKYTNGTDYGAGLVTEYSSLFEQAFSAWYTDPKGFLSCTLTFDDGALLIVPPDTNPNYRLALIPRDYKTSIRYLRENEDLASLLLDAERFVKAKGGHVSMSKDAEWRASPATPAQLGLLNKLRVQFPSDITKGIASQLITHHLAVSRFLEG